LVGWASALVLVSDRESVLESALQWELASGLGWVSALESV
jgi:hypothetical protein